MTVYKMEKVTDWLTAASLVEMLAEMMVRMMAR